ncbi:MAG: hypothetical protein Q9227_000327 [Pyrenula ochraceoflavens]
MKAFRRMQSWVPDPIVRLYNAVYPQLPDWSFITLHYLYFIGTSLIASLIFWGSSTPARSVSYTDSLFLCVSAMTEAGLNTVNLSELNTFQQFILFVLIMLGSAILVSIVVLQVRQRAFEHKLSDLIEDRRRKKADRLRLGRTKSFLSFSKRKTLSTATQSDNNGVVRGRKITPENEPQEQDEAAKEDVEKGESGPSEHIQLPPLDTSGHGRDLEPNGNGTQDALTDNGETVASPKEHIRFTDQRTPTRSHEAKSPTPRLRRSQTRLFAGVGVGVRPSSRHPHEANPFYHLDEIAEKKKQEGTFKGVDKYIESVNGFIGRNSQFHNLTEEEREALGGLEYRAVKLLSQIVPVYYVLWQLLGAIGVGAWMHNVRPYLARENGLNSYWTGAFFAVSSFNNSGMALLDANATALQTAAYPLLTMSLLILAGNTCFPPFLRLILWTLRQVLPDNGRWAAKREDIQFILNHPRRVFTNLFPSRQTWWLVASLVALNGFDWVMFEVLSIGNSTVEAIPGNYRALDGLFQAFAVRAGGFYVVAISGLRQGLLVLYVLMMYISAYPVTMTIRTTNIYEERSLNIYANEEPPKSQDQKGGFFGPLKRSVTNARPGESRADFVRHQLRGQLAHDIWWIAIAIWFIAIIESSQSERDPVTFSTFNIIFECVSGYGTVGISTGVPWAAYSFCGSWHKLSKLILMAVMLRGRHRGLPVAIDKAILLPDQTLAWAEEEDAVMRHEKGLNRPKTGMDAV